MKNIEFYCVDLFAGCGGLNEGFRQTGFQVIADVEMDHWACETLRTRHLYYELRKRKKTSWYYKYVKGEINKERVFNRFPDIAEAIDHCVIENVITDNSVDDIIEGIRKSKKYFRAKRIHVLLGGPPCQPYSLIGRARDPNRMNHDNRHYLYRHYLRILESLKPDFFVYENVPGLFSATANGERIFEKLIDDFANLAVPYFVSPPLSQVAANPNNYMLMSSHFGVPQERKRLILIGYRSNLKNKTQLIDNVFKRIQKLAVDNVQKSKQGKLRFPVVRDAIDDLPAVKPGEGNDHWFGEYNGSSKLCKYQKEMRRGSPGVLNHRARTHMASDLKRYEFYIKHWITKHQKADLNTLMATNSRLLPDHKHLDKFIDRFKVQWWEKPSSTITAHISKDGHYFIHPDLKQCRSFTAREAARCQSFPDNFKFEGPRTEQFKQVGNAVPPRLAACIAREIKEELIQIYHE